MKIKIANYKLYPYEKKFLLKEIFRVGGKNIKDFHPGDTIDIGNVKIKDALNLTYVHYVEVNDKLVPTIQLERELRNGKRINGQSRRYGPHSLHEYKGRYNPQTPRSIICSNFNKGDVILDPFMGSGTTLVEARGLGFDFLGVELNPMAHLIAKSKKLYEEVSKLSEIKIDKKINIKNVFNAEAAMYLGKWFPENILRELSVILANLNKLEHEESIIAKIILSNLLREHSYQDPDDLRIRRRKEIPAGSNLIESFLENHNRYRHKHEEWQEVISESKVNLINGDSTKLEKIISSKVDGTVCSPPYASALPYVDTYRLSMVALGLISPKDILRTEKMLIGARDINSIDKENFKERLSQLPRETRRIICYLSDKIDQDNKSGFRKKAVPFSLTNYAYLMLQVLTSLYKIEKKNAKNFWVIGHNKVKLDGEWFYIDTPKIVGELAKKAGFKSISYTELQTYSRYNIHSKNSIKNEFMLSFGK